MHIVLFGGEGREGNLVLLVLGSERIGDESTVGGEKESEKRNNVMLLYVL